MVRKKVLDLNPPIKYIFVTENIYLMLKIRIMYRNMKRIIVKVKKCFQSHANVRKCYLPYGLLRKTVVVI